MIPHVGQAKSAKETVLLADFFTFCDCLREISEGSTKLSPCVALRLRSPASASAIWLGDLLDASFGFCDALLKVLLDP